MKDPTFAADLANALQAMADAVEGTGNVSLHPQIVRRIAGLLRTAQSVNDFEQVGRAGLVVSIACGPMRGAFAWSVDCLCDRTGESFDRAYAARDFAHCLEIVETEAVKRGWLDERRV